MALGDDLPVTSQWTGSGDTTSTLTGSDSINASALNNYGISQDAEPFAASIAAMRAERGTRGNSHQKNVNLYLHQRQEKIIRYAHAQDGYEYVYIRPSQLTPAGTQGDHKLVEKYPGAIILPPGVGGYTEFSIPKNSILYTSNTPATRIHVQLSASDNFIKNYEFKIYQTQQHFLNQPTKAFIQVGKSWRTREVESAVSHNEYNQYVPLKYPAVAGTLKGVDQYYYTLYISPGKGVDQCEKIFYGARIPIKLA